MTALDIGAVPKAVGTRGADDDTDIRIGNGRSLLPKNRRRA